MLIQPDCLELVVGELQQAITSNLSGKHCQLAHAHEDFFYPMSDEHRILLQGVSKGFALIIDGLLNIRTSMVGMEILISTPGLDENYVCAQLATDMNKCFAYVQSIFDHIVAPVDSLFSLGLGKRANFATLQDWARTDSEKSADSLVNLLGSRINNCDWAKFVRDIRNEMIHRGAEPRSFLPLTRDDIYFQVLKADSAILTREQVHPKFFANVPPSYISFKAYAGVILGRLVVFLNQVAQVCFNNLAREMMDTGREDVLTIRLPDIALPLYWIEFGKKRILGEEESRFLSSPSPRYLQDDALINRENLLFFIENLLIDARTPFATIPQIADTNIRIAGFIKTLTTRSSGHLVPMNQEHSIYTFKAACATRMYHADQRKLLGEMLSILNWVRADLSDGTIKSFGQIQHNWTIRVLKTMTSVFNPSVKVSTAPSNSLSN